MTDGIEGIGRFLRLGLRGCVGVVDSQSVNGRKALSLSLSLFL